MDNLEEIAFKTKSLYQSINDMTLNTNVENILKTIILFYETDQFQDELFYNLYVFVEKEKYLANKYNCEMNLYNRLDDNTKNKLKEMFINKHKDDKSFDWDLFNKLGYEKVLDPDYTDFFDKQEFSNKQEYQLIDVNFETYHPDNGVNSNCDDYAFYYSEKDDFHFTRRDLSHHFKNRYIIKKSGDTHYYFCKPQNIYDNYPDYIIVYTGDKYVAINYRNGNLLKFKNELKKHNSYYAMGHFIIYKRKDHNSTWSIHVYNEKQEKVAVIYDVVKHFADYKKNRMLILKNNCEILIYDDNFNLLNSMTMDLDNYMDVNDGIITYSKGKNIIYYDYINQVVIDEFPMTTRYFNNYKFSEGLYSFNDNNGLLGYKNLDREVIIEPKYNETNPFLNNVARVIYQDKEGFIDRLGNFKEKNDCFEEMADNSIREKSNMNHTEFFWKFYYDFLWHGTYSRDSIARVSFADGKYEIRDFANRLRGYIDTIDNYIIDDNTPIKDIEFDGKEKVLKKE